MGTPAGDNTAAADYLIVGKVLTMDPAQPVAEAVAVAGQHVRAVGHLADLEALRGRRTEVIDVGGRFVLPAFHDAHLHFLKYARARGCFDCGHIDSAQALHAALRRWSGQLPPGAWLRAARYDDKLVRGRLPDRHDLDVAVSDRPVRLEHRALHLAIFNTRGLEALAVRGVESSDAGIERERDGYPTGRIFDGAYARRMGRLHDATGLSEDVRAASQHLLAWGVTTVQDASVTNDPTRWQLFQRLADDRALQVRLVVLPGAEHLRSMPAPRDGKRRIHLGPAKIMISEVSGEFDHVARLVAEVHDQGRGVAIHAVTESELVVALDALDRARVKDVGDVGGLDRIEHAASVPDEYLTDLRRAKLRVVGQPGLIYDRGDQYLLDHAPSEQGWLHRAQSFIAHGIPFAVGSDAPVVSPSPQLALRSLVSRGTRDGTCLGPAERLDVHAALRAMTVQPARCAGLEALGVLRRGAVADLTVVSSDWLSSIEPEPTWLTMTDGEVVWRDGTFHELSRQ